jgi:hypothetical protein
MKLPTLAQPDPPAPDPAWIAYEDFVDQQVCAALAYFGEVIAEQEPVEFRKHMLRQWPSLAARIVHIVRAHYEREVGR